MAKKRKSSRWYVPSEAKMGYSGVHHTRVERVKRWLRERGAVDIEVQLDDGDYTGHPPGPYYLVDWRYGKSKSPQSKAARDIAP